DADEVGSAVAAALAAMDPARVSQIFRAVLDRRLPGFDDVQVLRILIATGNRLGDTAVLVEYLDHLSRMSKRERPLDPRPLLGAVVYRWSWGVLAMVGPDRLRSRGTGLIYVVLITPFAFLVTLVVALFA